MKTILTEWGEMPLNDWREGMLSHAHKEASMAFWMRLIGDVIRAFNLAWSGLFLAGGVFGLFNGFPAHGLALMAVSIGCLVFALGFHILCKGFSQACMLKRQEIVDEVAAVMRTFK